MKRDQSPTRTVTAIGKLNFEGNVVPHTFFHRSEFKSEKGQTQLVAILILADDLYWYRPTFHSNEMAEVVLITRKFRSDKLQRTYEYYAQLYGVSKETATAAVKFLVDRGLITREFRTILLPDGRKASNVMFVEPVVDAVKVLMQPDTPDSPRWYWVAEPPKPNRKKEKKAEGGIRNKQDTYPNYSGYLSEVDRRRIRFIPETNTETYTGTSSKNSSERGGEYNVTGNARATGDQTAPVVRTSCAPSTTTDASLQIDLQGLSKHTFVVEAEAPNGGTAHAAQEPCAPPVQVVDQPTDGLFGQATDNEKVPGGADLDLDIASHDPQATFEVLKCALGGPKKLTALMDETPPGLWDGSRRRWLSQISPERAAELVTQGRQRQTIHPWTAITQLLDVEIGARIQRGSDSAPDTLVNVGGYTAAKPPEPQDFSQDLGKFKPGACWKEKESGRIRQIVSLEVAKNRTAGSGARYKLDDGTLIGAVTLIQKYEFQGEAPANA